MEFVAQYLQLLHGSRTAELPAGEAVAVFEAARRYELIDPETAPELANATTLWRDLHRTLCLTVADDFIERTAQPALKSVIERARAARVTSIPSRRQCGRRRPVSDIISTPCWRVIQRERRVTGSHVRRATGPLYV